MTRGESELTPDGSREAPAWPRLAVGDARRWRGQADVVTREELIAHRRHLESIAEAVEEGERVIRAAREEAAAIVAQAQGEASRLIDVDRRAWAEQYETQAQRIEDALGRAFTLTVESVMNELWGSDPQLAVQASVQRAIRLLSAEMRAAVECHPLDRAAVKVDASRLGARDVIEDPDLPRGVLRFASAQGDAKLDGEGYSRALIADLRRVLNA